MAMVWWPLASAQQPKAPATRVSSVRDVYHGVSVDDPYRWLEDGTSGEVRSWAAAQTAYARAHLDALPGRGAIADTLLSFTSQASPSFFDFKSAGSQLFARYNDPAKQQPMLGIMSTGANTPKVFLDPIDPNVLDPTGGTAIDWYVPSLDGRRVAVSLSRGGSEDGDLHFF